MIPSFITSSLSNLLSQDEELKLKLSMRGISVYGETPVRFGTYLGGKLATVIGVYTGIATDVESAAALSFGALANTMSFDKAVVQLDYALLTLLPVSVSDFENLHTEMADIAEKARGRKLYALLESANNEALTTLVETKIRELAGTQGVTIAEGSIKEQISADASIEAVAGVVATQIFGASIVSGENVNLQPVIAKLGLAEGWLTQDDVTVSKTSQSQALDLTIKLQKKVTLVQRPSSFVATNIMNAAELSALAQNRSDIPKDLIDVIGNLVNSQIAPEKRQMVEKFVLLSQNGDGGSLQFTVMSSIIQSIPAQKTDDAADTAADAQVPAPTTSQDVTVPETKAGDEPTTPGAVA